MEKLTIEVYVNGDAKALPQGCTITQAIEHLGMSADAQAVAVNHQFVPQSAYNDTQLKAGDFIDIVSPMQGG